MRHAPTDATYRIEKISDRMKKPLFLLLLSLLPPSMRAQQQFLLRGRVVDAVNDTPVGFATTALLRDSTAVAAVAADAQGRFELTADAAGDYHLQITMVGYNPETRPVALREAVTDAGTIRLRQGVDIDQVTVTIQKPLVTADAEKTTYSVEDDPQAASSTLEEILRKVPQLTIDAEGNVKLNGQSDFKVLVNGRSSAMFKNFKDVIRSMPASQIKKIEVITEPSMKYDAEGSGGIINIITARKEFDGYNGSLNYNTGLDNRRNYGGATLTVQKGKFAASLQGFFFQMDNENRPYETQSRQENLTSEQQRYRTSESAGYGEGHNEYFTLNLSYQPDTLNLVTLEGSLWTGGWKSRSEDRVRMLDADERPTVEYATHDYDNYPYTGFQIGANYERRFRKPEHTITVSDMVETDPDKGYDLVAYDGILNYPSSRRYKRHTSRSVANTFQLDYYNPLAEHHYLEAGGKYIYRINKGYQNEIPWVDPAGFDPANTAKYDDLRQRQQIFSLYAGYGLKFAKVSARAGVRMERTWNHADADSSEEGIYDYGNRLLNFIPYLSLTYKPRDGHNLSLSYTERLRRPSITMLSTYLDDSDPYNTSQGNPDLKASTTHTLSLKYNCFSPKWSGTFTLSGHLSNDGISRWTHVDDTGVAHTTYSNNVRERTAGARLSINYTPSEKFTLALNGQGGYSHYRLPAEKISTEEFTFDQNLNLNIALWKAATVSLGEGYNSGSANLGSKSGDYFYTYATLSQKFFKEKLQVSVSCYNPFTEYQTYDSTAQTPTYRSQSRSRHCARLFSIGAYWRFGKRNVEVKHTRKSISNDDTMQSGDKQGGKQ